MAHEEITPQVGGGEPLNVEGQQQHNPHQHPGDERRDEPQRSLVGEGSAQALVQGGQAPPQIRLRPGPDPQQMAPNEHRQDDYEADGVLRLDEHAQHG